MTRFKKWLLNKLVRDEICGDNPLPCIKEVYRTIRVACEDRFPEDNHPTITGYLQEQFEKANDQSAPA